MCIAETQDMCLDILLGAPHSTIPHHTTPHHTHTPPYMILYIYIYIYGCVCGLEGAIVSVAQVTERLCHFRWIVRIPEYREPSAYMFLVRVCLDSLFRWWTFSGRGSFWLWQGLRPHHCEHCKTLCMLEILILSLLVCVCVWVLACERHGLYVCVVDSRDIRPAGTQDICV